jgi:hypothetical protein
MKIDGPVGEEVNRRRVLMYSQKLLGRLLKKIPDIQE